MAKSRPGIHRCPQMTGHGAKFGRKMEEAIIALLTTRTVEEAARVVGVSTKTLLCWMKEPEFEYSVPCGKTRGLRSVDR